MTSTPVVYTKAGPQAGAILRSMVALMRQGGVNLPVLPEQEVVLSVSAGVDSMVMADLLLRLGRRILPHHSRVTVLHLDHGWRPESADQERDLVQDHCLNRWGGVRFESIRLSSPQEGRLQGEKGVSPEAYSRSKRLEVYDRFLSQGAWVWTAHHLDDQAETLFWRFLRGEWDSHGEGIYPVYARGSGQMIRPLLGVWKSQLRECAIEEGLSWLEDPTNHEGDLMRTQLRQKVFPELERVFPGFKRRLVRYASVCGAKNSSRL